MRIIIKIFFGIVLASAVLILSEILLSYFVVKQIPREMIQRDSLSAFKYIFDASLILKFFPLILLSLIIFAFTGRFNRRYLIFAITGGLIGFLISWSRFVSQLTEGRVTSLNVSSTDGLSYLVLPIITLPTALAGILAGLSGIIIYCYFFRSDTFNCYNSVKGRKTYLFEGSLYLVSYMRLFKI